MTERSRDLTDSLDDAIRNARHRVEPAGKRPWVLLVGGMFLGAALVGALAIAFAWFAVSRAIDGRRASGDSVAQATSAPAERQLWTCSMHPQVIQPEPGICPICHMELTPLKSDGHADASGAITIDPVIVQNMGVRLAEVTRGPVVQSVRVVGYLEEPEPLHRDINLRVNGWIEKLYANIDGMPVTKGQALFDLYSPELTVAVDELIAAKKQAGRAGDNALSSDLLESARRKLAQFGLEAQQIETLEQAESAPRSIPILSPLDGHLTSKMVYEGAAVKAGDLVMRLASRHIMWVDAQVPEQRMQLISDGQPVRATLVSQPAKVYSGKVLFVHPHVDPQTRTALVRIEIDNQDLSLRQGMYATVEILADAYRDAPMVPQEAVIDTGRRQMVFVSLGSGKFEPRDVTLGLPGRDGLIEVVQGVSAGDRIVASGQFLLDSESRLKEAVAKHLAVGLPVKAEPVATIAKPPTPTQPAIVKAPAPHADDVIRAYLLLAQKLGVRQEADTPVDPSSLISAASMSATHGKGDPASLALRIAESAKAMQGKPLAEQREAFVQVSGAAVEYARKVQLSPEIGPTLFVMHCPMAFSDKGADWMQRTDDLANPYYAVQMKKCGDVTERIELGK